MSYLAAACGAAIGMMVGLLIFTNAWRINLLPKEYDFLHEYGKAMIRSDKKPLTYSARMFVGMFFHPMIFVFIWGEDGLLGINILNSSIISAVILLIIEALLFGVLLWTKILSFVPDELISRIFLLQFVMHVIIGLLMGLTFDYLQF